MRYLSNIHDPGKLDARRYHVFLYHTQQAGIEAMDREWDMYMEWVNAHIRARPQATDLYTVEELEAMDMIGIYADD